MVKIIQDGYGDVARGYRDLLKQCLDGGRYPPKPHPNSTAGPLAVYELFKDYVRAIEAEQSKQ